MARRILISIAVLFALLCGAALAEQAEVVDSGECGDNGANVTWTLDSEGTLTISGEGEMADFDPAPWFEYRSSILNLAIEDGVTDITWYAFGDCAKLVSASIPNSVTSIGACAFVNCGSLTSITLPEQLTSIGDSAFEACSSLTSITIPKGVTEISASAFCACKNLSRITIPDGVTDIGYSAFASCTGLTSITIPDSVNTIGGFAFLGCNRLASVTLPESELKIADDAFSNCSSALWFFAPEGSSAASWATEHGFRTSASAFTENGVVYSIADGEAKVTGHTGDLPADVELPESVAGVPLTAIGSEAFSYCQNLRSLRIPEGVTTIDMLALSYSGLETIYLPRSLTFIDDSAFEACSDALVFVAPSDSCAAQRAGEMGYMCFESKPRSIVGYNLRYFLANDEITVVRCAEDAASVDVPAEVLGYPVTAIARGAFSCCASLTELALPDTIRSIGNEAFWGCDGLTDVRIPDSVTRIGSYAFGCCSKLASIDLPNRLSSLGTGVFYNCPSLKKVDLPAGVNCVPSETFGFCDGLTEVTIPEGVTSIGNLAFEECRSLTAVALPDSLITLDEGAFYGCTSLTRITIPYGTTTLEACAFGRCTGLTEVGLPATVTRIDDYAFEDCDSKLKIYAPSGCPAYDWANARDMLLTMWFVSENDISYVLIDNTAVVIGHEGDPSALTIPARVYGLPVDGLDEQALAFCERMTSISLPDSLTFIGNEAFHFCSRLPSITIPEGVTEIGSYAFSYCLRLTEVALPDSLTTIGDRAFAYCEALPGITIPKNVTSIDSGAFSNCTSLGWITFLGRDAISIAEDAIPESVTICCYRDSAVERWALENGYTCESIDEHIHSLIIDPAVPATHATPGRTMGMRCTECGEVLIQSEPIPVVEVDKLVLPANLKTIEEEAFANDSIACVVLPDGCKAIGAGAFRGCMELRFIEIPSSVTSIDGTAFEDCDNDLIIVTASGSEAQRFAAANGITCVLLD